MLNSICKEVFVAQSCVTFAEIPICGSHLADFVFVWQAMEDVVEGVADIPFVDSLLELDFEFQLCSCPVSVALYSVESGGSLLLQV